MPDTPDDRYQLVHDYLAGVIRERQAPRLEALMAELEEEKRQRRLAEEEKEALSLANQKARRRLAWSAGLLGVSLIGALIAVPVAIKASQFAQQKITEANQALTGVKNANRAASEAEKRQQDADRAAGEAQAAAQAAQTGAAAAKEAQEAALQQQQIAQQQAVLAQQQQAAAQAQSRLAEAAQKEAEDKRAQAQAEAKLAQAGARLERLGAGALSRFEFDQVGSLMAAVKAGADLSTVLKAHNIDVNQLAAYPAASPLLALRSILDQVWRMQVLEGHQAWVLSAAFSPDGERIVTASDDNTARLWDVTGRQVAVLEGHQAWVLSAAFSPGWRNASSPPRMTTRRGCGM